MAAKQNNSIWMRWLGFALIVVLFDQLAKITVLYTLAYGDSQPITAFFNLVLTYNRGAAFSFLATASGWQRWLFIALGIVAACFICYLLQRHGRQRFFCSALSLILGGALGNIIDRLRYGYVIDFLDFHLRGWHWPAFNLADSAIVCGALLLLLDELRRVRSAR